MYIHVCTGRYVIYIYIINIKYMGTNLYLLCNNECTHAQYYECVHTHTQVDQNNTFFFNQYNVCIQCTSIFFYLLLLLWVLLWVPLLQTGTTEAQLYLYVPKIYIYRRYEGTCVHEVYINLHGGTPIYNVYMTCTIRTSTLRIFCRQLNHYCFHTCVRVQSILT